MLAEKLLRDPAGGRLVVDVFGAVLAVLVLVPLTRLGLRPRTAGAVDPVRLIDVEQIDRCSHERGLFKGILQRVHHPRNPSGRFPGRLDLWVLDAHISVAFRAHAERPNVVVAFDHCANPHSRPRRFGYRPIVGDYHPTVICRRHGCWRHYSRVAYCNRAFGGYRALSSSATSVTDFLASPKSMVVPSA